MQVLKVPRSFLGNLPSFVRVAAAAYAVLGLFTVAFVVVRWGWPTVSLSASIVLAAVVAAPVGLGLVWNRLSGIKLYGVEVALTQASARLDAKLVDSVMVQYYSDNPGLLQLISKALVGREEPVEIPLRSPEKPFWWSTRLFLIAALAQDYTSVRAFVFVDGGEERRFIGLANPADVRLSFGRQFPSLEDVYGDVRGKLSSALLATQQVEDLITQWSVSQFSQDGKVLNEEEISVGVNRSTLRQFMDKPGDLNDQYVRWNGFQDRSLLAGIVDFDGPYVPLVEYGQLHKVVSRRAVVEEIAAKALK